MVLVLVLAKNPKAKKALGVAPANLLPKPRRKWAKESKLAGQPERPKDKSAAKKEKRLTKVLGAIKKFK
jgi:hypothetical protein